MYSGLNLTLLQLSIFLPVHFCHLAKHPYEQKWTLLEPLWIFWPLSNLKAQTALRNVNTLWPVLRVALVEKQALSCLLSFSGKPFIRKEILNSSKKTNNQTKLEGWEKASLDVNHAVGRMQKNSPASALAPATDSCESYRADFFFRVFLDHFPGSKWGWVPVLRFWEERQNFENPVS